MDFEDKLRNISDRAERESRSELQKHVRTLAGLIAKVLKDQTWNDLTARTDKQLIEAADKAQDLARILDASGYLFDKVFHAGQGLIVDLRLKQDLHEVQEQIQEMFASKEAPPRGFVYVAWTASPEEYWYVGKANTVDRLNLAAHGKLARATAPGHATKLSLIFPSQSREDMLLGVEASVLALIEDYTGQLPRLNERRGKIVQNSGANELRMLSNFLGSIADDIFTETRVA